MNNDFIFHALGMAYALSGPYTQDVSIEDLKYINNELVQNSIFDFELGLLKYMQDESEETLKNFHQKYLENLNKMNNDEQTYFKKYCEKLVNGIGTKENEPNNNLKKERKL